MSPQHLWNQVLAHLQQQLNRPTYDNWIAPLAVAEFTTDCLTIRAPDPFTRNWLQKHYTARIAEAVRELLGESLEVRFISPPETADSETPEAIAPAPRQSALNPKYTFEQFVVGETNRFAHAAAQTAAERPGCDFNPLFIWGGVGLGKSHLMHAIGHYRREVDPRSSVCCVSTETFINDLVEAMQGNRVRDFRDRYRAADVLILDDIQFIEGSEATQEELFHTFNALYAASKQIVFASDRPPHAIPRCSERLTSRFAMGLTADIQPPSLEMRMAILHKKAEIEGRNLPQPVVEYIATHYTANIRELEGALIRAIAYCSIQKLPLAVQTVSQALDPPAVGKVQIAPDTILMVVSEHFHVPVDDLKGSSRRREISFARQVGMFLIRQHTDLSLPRIGDLFGGKDHTTVLHSCNKIRKLQQKDLQLQRLLRQLSERITAG